MLDCHGREFRQDRLNAMIGTEEVPAAAASSAAPAVAPAKQDSHS